MSEPTDEIAIRATRRLYKGQDNLMAQDLAERLEQANAKIDEVIWDYYNQRKVITKWMNRAESEECKKYQTLEDLDKANDQNKIMRETLRGVFENGCSVHDFDVGEALNQTGESDE